MDNAAFHKNEDLKTMVDKAGHIIEYLPPYSPDLNPYYYPQILPLTIDSIITLS